MLPVEGPIDASTARANGVYASGAGPRGGSPADPSGSEPDPVTIDDEVHGSTNGAPLTPRDRVLEALAARRSSAGSPKSAPRTLIERAEEQLAAAMRDISAPGVLLAERTRARREVVTMIRDIDRMRRAEESLQADVVRRSPFFRSATRELLAALRPFPDAARAVAARFGELEGALDEEDEERERDDR